MSLAMLIIVIAIVLLLVGGGLGQERFGYWGWSPLGVILLVLLILWLTGRLS